MKIIITRAYISTVFAVVLPFLSLSAFADCYQDGFNDGLAACPTTSNCDAKYNEGFNAGKSQCQSNPASCGIPTDDGTTCSNAVSKCGIPTDDGISCNNAVTECTDKLVNIINQSCGLDKVLDCGINIVTQKGKEAGKDECKKDLYSCFGTSEPSEETVVFCSNAEDNNASDKNCLKYVGPEQLNFKLRLPVVYLEGDPKTIVTDVKMNLVSLNPIVFVLEPTELKATGSVTLEVRVENEGGQVISLPVGIRCSSDDSNDDDCTENYEKDSTVELFAVPSDSGFSFSGWNCDDGDIESTDNHLSLDMDTNKTCTATFAELSTDP